MSRWLRRFDFDPSLWPALLAGLLARLLLMPLAAHSDLMHMYWNAHLVLSGQQAAFGLQTLLIYAHAAYLWLLGSLLPPAGSLWISQADKPFLNPFLGGRVVSTQGWFDFISHPQAYRTLFLLKLPYLFFDLACVWLLYRLGTGRSKSSSLVKLWWLNPILIFAVYVFGRHEVVALFFVLLSIYLTQRGRRMWGLLALGVAIALRYYAIFLLPFYVLSFETSWKKWLLAALCGLAVWGGVNLLVWGTTGSTEALRLTSLSHGDYLLAMKFQIADWDNLYIFPLLYCLLVLHRLYNRAYGLESLRRYSLVALLLLFALSYSGQSPHYWTWFLPFLVLEMAEDRRFLPLHLAQAACLLGYSFIGGRSTAGYLFAPLAPDFFWSLPAPIELIGEWLSPEVFISMARTAFSAITLWMIYLAWQRLEVISRSPSGQE